MRRILKYTVPVDDQSHTFELTGDVLHVSPTPLGEVVEFWAEHDDEAPEFMRTYQVIPTGQEMPRCSRWIGTGRASRLKLVWHLVELVRPCQG